MNKLFVTLCLLYSLCLNSQVSIGFTIGGIGYHPKNKSNHSYYKWKIDKKGKFVGYAGISIFLTYKVNNYIGFKLLQGLVFHDCAGKFAGISHVGINLYDDIIGFKFKRDALSMSVGPFWYYRKNWMKIPEYIHDSTFIRLSKTKKWESLFVWYGGQIEYIHTFNNHKNFALNILPAYPYLYTFGVGEVVRYPQQ